jgi:hypothetical protein
MTPKTRKALELAQRAILYGGACGVTQSEEALLAITEALAEPAPHRLTLTNVDLLDMWKDATYKAMREDEGEAHEFYARAIEARIFGDVK